MDLISLYYFKILANDLNMTRTASKLSISQQTLSNQIQSLERNLHTKLFERKPKLALTEAGKASLEFANSVLAEEKQFNAFLGELAKEERGTINFGASAMRSSMCLPAILPKFYTRYPNVNFNLVSDNSIHLQNLLAEGELDLAICAFNEGVPKNLERKLVLADQLYFCVAEKLLDRVYGPQKKLKKQTALKGVKLENFSELPFFLSNAQNRLMAQITKCFEEAGYTPITYLSSALIQMMPDICSKALAACIIPQMCITNSLPMLYRNNVNIFPLLYRGKYVFHNNYLVYNEKKYLTKYMVYFAELTTSYFQSISENNPSHIVKSK